MATAVSLIDYDYIVLNSPVYGNLDRADIEWIIPMSQDMHIERLTGTALYSKLKTDAISGTLAGSYKTLMDDYICPALVHYVVSDAIAFNQIKFTSKGLVVKSSDNSDPAGEEAIVRYQNQLNSFAEYYGERLLAYLCANSSSFPEYNQSVNGEVDKASSAYRTTIYIPK